MAHPLIRRLPALLVMSAAAATISPAPALASEGPPGPPPPGGAPLPAALSPVNFVPLPAGPAGHRSRPSIRRAKLAPRRIRRGRHARLRLVLSGPGRVRITLARAGHGRRGRSASLTIAAGRTRLTVRLPSRSHGRALPVGRYRVTITVLDAQGNRSRPVRRTLVIRRRSR